jgi:ElaB/YqjD/DUF883 family membrane-anchored ribosome-binding protein
MLKQLVAQDMADASVIVLEPNDNMSDGFMHLDEDTIIHELCEDPTEQDRSDFEASEPIELVISFDGDLPGAPESPFILEPEKNLNVTEEDLEKNNKDSKEEDENDAKYKKSKKSDKWDWESKGADGFVLWVKERFDTVPKHSGYDTAGLERAVSYLDKLDSEISKAMRLDLEGELDADKIEEIRSKIEHGIDMLNDRLDNIKKTKKDSRKKKAEADEAFFTKEAQKATPIKGIVISVPLFIFRIASVCINGTISAGHDLEDLFAKQVKKWDLTDREQAEVMQLFADMGYPLKQDRGFMLGEEVDVTSSDNFDWAAQYQS